MTPAIIAHYLVAIAVIAAALAVAALAAGAAASSVDLTAGAYAPEKSLTASNPHKPAPPHRWGAYESARASGRFHLQNRRGFFQLIS